MATLSRGYTFGATETVTNAKLHALVDDGAVSSIINNDIGAGAAIAESKIDFSGASAVLIGEDQTITSAKTFSGNVIIGTANQGDVYYDDGTKMTRLTPGTDGQFLQTQGAAANPQWAAVGTANMPSGTVGKVAITMDQTARTVTVSKAMPADDTAVLFDEGGAYSALDTSFTATNASSTLIVEVVVAGVSNAGNGGNLRCALFKDGTGTSASVAHAQGSHGDSTTTKSAQILTIMYTCSAVDTNAHTWKVNVAQTNSTDNVPINQNPSGNTMGNTFVSSIKITEILP